ncbi:CaiB/BaiF CoA-transferase family protein [Variovorax soli]|uniref:Crotonobetainyl-CoA:carnitine CoA-transferase CaiB-like acyl-CoA transferase n=1 Tax=Variovorax soli TaxID=376815 RepID=A0ABU1NJC3_9BURK|nr:CaiB/BaiF CoA-transferase family protein [Variovorax soli]MDR6538570.1 crotonobetainyl-CoA:carnitine CoA-transferase CaiB-like acyl-CoA transferase [Variovorax soli]
MSTAPHKPLAGVRVIEMAQIMAGPTCGMMLADLGAEVIKIEKWPSGDDARQYQKPGDSAMPPSFRMINRGKRSLALDVRTPQGKEVLLRLVRQADVLTENFRVGVMERLGLAYADLKPVNPALIYCSITGYGRTGPMAKTGGFDLILQAFSGIIAATGEADRDPVKPGVSIADTNAGILAALAIVSAYVHRLKTGEGQHVSTSLLQAAMQQTYWLAANYFSSGRETQRLGTAHSLIAPYQVFKASDGRMVIGAGNTKAWQGMCEVLGHPEWITDTRFDQPQQRVKHRAELEMLIEAVLAAGTVAEWCERFDGAGVPAGPVNSAGQALEHPQTRAVGMVIEVPDGEGGMMRGIGTPLTLDGKAEAATMPAPRLAEHSSSVLRDFGFEQEEIAALMASGVVQQG